MVEDIRTVLPPDGAFHSMSSPAHPLLWTPASCVTAAVLTDQHEFPDRR